MSLDVCSDAVLNELQNSATSEQDKFVLNDILVQLLECVMCAMKKQLHDYLEGIYRIRELKLRFKRRRKEVAMCCRKEIRFIK